MFGLISAGGSSVTVTTGTSLSSPIGIAVDPNNNPWVADGSGTIYGFQPPYSNGMSPTSTLSNGDYPSPIGLAIDIESGFWIADSGTGHVVNCLAPYGQGTCSNVISDAGALWVAVFPESEP
jgi:sugar lactone lactonase YvrE